MQVLARPLVPKKSAFEIKLVRFRIFGRLFRNRTFFRTGERCLQRLRNGLRNIALDRENVSQFSIVGLSPKMRVGHCIDQLYIHPDLVIRLLDAAFENIHDAKLLCDVAQVFRRAFEMLRRGARNYFEIGYFGEPCQYFVLDTFSEEGVVGIAAEIVEW